MSIGSSNEAEIRNEHRDDESVVRYPHDAESKSLSVYWKAARAWVDDVNKSTDILDNANEYENLVYSLLHDSMFLHEVFNCAPQKFISRCINILHETVHVGSRPEGYLTFLHAAKLFQDLLDEYVEIRRTSTVNSATPSVVLDDMIVTVMIHGKCFLLYGQHIEPNKEGYKGIDALKNFVTGFGARISYDTDEKDGNSVWANGNIQTCVKTTVEMIEKLEHAIDIGHT